MFENRKYVVIPSSEIQNVDFQEVLETSANTCRYSIDGNFTFVKYEGEMPPSIVALENKSDEYSHAQILEIMSGSDWQSRNIIS